MRCEIRYDRRRVCDSGGGIVLKSDRMVKEIKKWK